MEEMPNWFLITRGGTTTWCKLKWWSISTLRCYVLLKDYHTSLSFFFYFLLSLLLAYMSLLLMNIIDDIMNNRVDYIHFSLLVASRAFLHRHGA